nr:integrase, catalytic region, zinc finger, CCHC-type, peptidase aspartic, catalytic [Tanacetum cinerariifolium]
MYRIDNRTAHTRAPQLPQTVKNTNPCVSTSTGVNDKPTVSRPELKSNQSRDKVLPNNNQVKVKKTQVKVHPSISSVSNKMKSVTACKDSLNSRTLNANVVCATCNKCLVDSNHFACVTKMLNDVHARTKKPNVVPISTRKPKSQANKSIATPNKKQVASKSTKQKPQSYFRVLYENNSNLKLLCNFVEKFLGTVRFGNDQFTPILGYGDLVQGNVTINRVYYVEGLNHNLFSVGQFCDADLEKKTVVVTFDPLALIAEKTKVSKRKEKVVVSLNSKGSDADDFNELKKITAWLAKAFNQRKIYSKPTNNNLRTSFASRSGNKKQEYVKSVDKKVEKKDDQKKRDMIKVKCYNCKKEGHFAKDCKKAKVKDYEYYKTKMLLAKKDKVYKVLLAEEHTWMESSSDSDQEINANMVFMAQIKKVLSDSEASSSSADDKIYEVSYYLSESKSESEYETSEYYDTTTTYGLLMNDNDDQIFFRDCENFP